MREFLGTPVAQSVIWGCVGVVLILVGVYIVRSFRGRSANDTLTTHDMLTNFRELHQGGDISDEEFRTIKTRLGARLQDELKDTGDRG